MLYTPCLFNVVCVKVPYRTSFPMAQPLLQTSTYRISQVASSASSTCHCQLHNASRDISPLDGTSNGPIPPLRSSLLDQHMYYTDQRTKVLSLLHENPGAISLRASHTLYWHLVLGVIAFAVAQLFLLDNLKTLPLLRLALQITVITIRNAWYKHIYHNLIATPHQPPSSSPGACNRALQILTKVIADALDLLRTPDHRWQSLYPNNSADKKHGDGHRAHVLPSYTK